MRPVVIAEDLYRAYQLDRSILGKRGLPVAIVPDGSRLLEAVENAIEPPVAVLTRGVSEPLIEEIWGALQRSGEPGQIPLLVIDPPGGGLMRAPPGVRLLLSPPRDQLLADLGLLFGIPAIAPRLPVRAPVQLGVLEPGQRAPAEWLEAHSLNVSRSGILLSVPDPLRSGLEVVLRTSLAPGAGNDPAEGRAEVVRSELTPRGWQAALRFTLIDRSLEDRLGALTSSAEQLEDRIQRVDRLVAPRLLVEAERSAACRGDLDRLARLARVDPSLALAVAAAAAAQQPDARQRPATLTEALEQLGPARLRLLALGGILAPVAHDERAAHLVRHALAVSLLAAELAPEAGISPELAQTAGLLHDVGLLVALGNDDDVGPVSWLADAAPPLEEEAGEDALEAERRQHGLDHGEVARRFLRRMGLPELLTTAAALHHQPGAEPPWRPAASTEEPQPASPVSGPALAALLRHADRLVHTRADEPGPRRALAEAERLIADLTCIAPVSTLRASRKLVELAMQVGTGARPVLAPAPPRRRLETGERLAPVARLAAGVAHEVNNPLAFAVNGLQALIERLPPSAELERLAAETRTGLDRIAEVVRRLQLFGASTPPAELPHADVNSTLDTAVAGVLARRRRDASLGKLGVRRHYVPEARVPHDPQLLGHALDAILENASQAMPGGGTLTLITRRQPANRTPEAPHGTLEIVITDEGSGIAPELLPRVVEPFFTTRGVGGGMGLGLAVSHGVIVAHRGTLELVSPAGEGATVIVRLPLGEG